MVVALGGFAHQISRSEQLWQISRTCQVFIAFTVVLTSQGLKTRNLVHYYRFCIGVDRVIKGSKIEKGNLNSP